MHVIGVSGCVARGWGAHETDKRAVHSPFWAGVLNTGSNVCHVFLGGKVLLSCEIDSLPGVGSGRGCPRHWGEAAAGRTAGSVLQEPRRAATPDRRRRPRWTADQAEEARRLQRLQRYAADRLSSQEVYRAECQRLGAGVAGTSGTMLVSVSAGAVSRYPGGCLQGLLITLLAFGIRELQISEKMPTICARQKQCDPLTLTLQKADDGSQVAGLPVPL